MSEPLSKSGRYKRDHPEKTREYQRRDNSKRQPQKNAWAAAWGRSPAGRSTCVECGNPKGIGSAKAGDGLCQDCIKRRAANRRDRIVELFNDGVLLKEIAANVGVSMNALKWEMDPLRKAGRIGYRYKVKDGRRVRA